MSQPTPTPEAALVPLDLKQLSPGAQRFFSPGVTPPMLSALARGKALLAPPELIPAMYHLAAQSQASGDAATLQTVRDTIAALGEAPLRGALQGDLAAPVLDFLARALHRQRYVFELILRHRNTSDSTVEFFASACEGEELELIAQDEQRLLQAPGVVAALYMNPRTRASTALRAVELAARNGIVVDIPGYEDVVASLQGVELKAEDDSKFQQAVESGKAVAPAEPAADEPVPTLSQEDIERTQAAEEAPKTDEKVEEAKDRFEDLPVPHQIRLATLGTSFDRSIAIRSSIRTVCMAAIRSPAVRPNEVIKYAGNRALHEDVIRYIANKKDWTQLASIRLSLVNNNKTPLGTALRFLPFLHARDLKAVSKSRNIPAPLVKAAKELMSKRETR